MSCAEKSGTTPMPQPVLRHMREAQPPPFARAGRMARTRSTPRRTISPRLGARMPASASSSSDWPLPATPAMPRISPARSSKLTPLTRGTPRRSLTSRSCTASRTSPGRAGALVTFRETARPTMLSASARSRGFTRRGLVHDRALAHDRDAVGHGHDLAELVGDEDHGLPLLAQPGEHAKEPGRFPAA